MKKSVWIALAVVVVLVGLYAWLGGGNASQEAATNPETQGSAASQNSGGITGGVDVPAGIEVTPSVVHTVRVTADGFEPATLTVKVGDTVVWQNDTTRGVWPASAVHPSHTAYDGTSLDEHCPNTSGTAFDSCGAVAAGASWGFTFNKAGTWGYHDHLDALVRGTVVVEP